MNAYKPLNVLTVALIFLSAALTAEARIKLVALPERAQTTVRLDNPLFTLVEEERVLTLQPGLNKVDFAWNGVSIDADSIRLEVLSHPKDVRLLNVSYPPNENALVWEISSTKAFEEKVKVSYLLSNIDRLITYKAVTGLEETNLELKSNIVLRNFSGEDFDAARIFLNGGDPIETGISHEETKRILYMKTGLVPIQKIWHWDSQKHVWDPETVSRNVGIPVTYTLKNDGAGRLGKGALLPGKARVFQVDGHGSTILLGEDHAGLTPVGEELELYIGDSRDIVVTQRKMIDERVSIRYNTHQRPVLYDNEEVVVAKIENFKDKPAVLKMVQHIPGEWDMKNSSLKYEIKDANTIEYTIELPANGSKELKMHYSRRNIRG